MRGESHRKLGLYLAEKYLMETSQINTHAFLIGCIQPDRNPVTYLKGSLREQWLRGHNYRNARRFMRRIALRLERKQTWNLYDYYTLGKLIHYTADAFTYAHNDSFSSGLYDHKKYEHVLQEYFLNYLNTDPAVDFHSSETVMDTIQHFHREYLLHVCSLHRDSRYALTVCCCILVILMKRSGS